jgi:hypothetical protein
LVFPSATSAPSGYFVRSTVLASTGMFLLAVRQAYPSALRR